MKRWELYVSLAREGLNAQDIADRCGVALNTVYRAIWEHQLSFAVLRNIRCAHCGGLMRRPEYHVPGRQHFCAKRACQNAVDRARRHGRIVSPERQRGGWRGWRGDRAVAARILARKGTCSEREAARQLGVGRSTVNGIWRGVRHEYLQQEAGA